MLHISRANARSAKGLLDNQGRRYGASQLPLGEGAVIAAQPRLAWSYLWPVEVVVEDVGGDAARLHGVFDQKIILIPVAVGSIPQVVSAIPISTLRLDSHAEPHCPRMKPPLPVRPIRALLVARERTDRHPVTMGPIDGPQVFLGVRHFARRPAPTVFGSQSFEGQLGPPSKRSAQRADHRCAHTAGPTKSVIRTNLLPANATRQCAFTPRRFVCPASPL